MTQYGGLVSPAAWPRNSLEMGSTVRYANLDVETLASAINDGLSPTALERAEEISRTMNNNGAAIAAMRLAEDHS
jgi:hypothetical protein